MRAEDLQIGDWVICTYLSINKPVKVMEIKTVSDEELKVVINYNGTPLVFSRTYIDPIPLTPEILEKNGFHYTNQHTLKGADTYVLRLEQRGFDYTITIKLNDYFALDSYDDRMYRLAEIETGKWYVHQLQHALRLCGITKEIQI